MKNSNRLMIVLLVIFTAFASIGCAKKKSGGGRVTTAPVTTTNNNNNTPDIDNDSTTVSCEGVCKSGEVEVTSNGQKVCLPKNVCSACYGYYKGYCYQGTFAYQYYYGSH